jgi:hypothetical protein
VIQVISFPLNCGRTQIHWLTVCTVYIYILRQSPHIQGQRLADPISKPITSLVLGKWVSWYPCYGL